MNMNTTQSAFRSTVHPFVSACSASCAKLVSKIQRIKSALQTEFRLRAYNRDRMVQLALNEAEALAHETGFPLLTFPTLAREKLEAVAAWNGHQQMVRRTSFQRLRVN